MTDCGGGCTGNQAKQCAAAAAAAVHSLSSSMPAHPGSFEVLLPGFPLNITTQCTPWHNRQEAPEVAVGAALPGGQEIVVVRAAQQLVVRCEASTEPCEWPTRFELEGSNSASGSAAVLELHGMSMQRHQVTLKGGAIRTNGNTQLTILNARLVDNAGSGPFTKSNQVGGCETKCGDFCYTGLWPWGHSYHCCGHGCEYHDTGHGSFGGAIFASGGTIAITGSNLSSNVATGKGEGQGWGAVGGGGAIYASGTIVKIKGSTLSKNTVSGAGAGGGGAIYTAGGSVDIHSSTLSRNAVDRNTVAGGAIHAIDSMLQLSRCVLSENESKGSLGGAIYATGSLVSITGSTLFGNDGGGAGGAIYASAGTVAITNSALSHNKAGGPGAGMYAVAAASVKLINVTWEGNTRNGQSSNLHCGSRSGTWSNAATMLCK